ncbi:condensation domain-containing protein [Actinokineospora auranticolor]|uniref:Condensation domain-containing protein n=1 Tax=Actinokineospora auranticolor TaxID=155976 RepID=A0A2S6GT37_9PSEU|nr:condensation domain-containing protein [Actinokineospora auranticolor]PPK68370.1 condensation domain-containing protein [Actinokineospora auranticolor]
MTDTILVDFRGTGSGTGELTWGQRTVWRVVAKTGRAETMGGIVALPPGSTAGDAVTVLRYVMGRHQSLRTRLSFDAADGGPRQRVSESGQIALEVVEAGAEDPAAVADRVKKAYEDKDFDHEHEWPVRMAVVVTGSADGVAVADRRATHSVAVYNHLNIDAHGLEALVADLSTMDPATGEPTAELTATQPLELAAQQRQPAVLRNSDAALRYWERVLRTVSAKRVDGTADETRSPRWGEVEFTSPASLLATRAVAARIGTDTSPVLLAAYATALARTIGNNPVAVQIAVNNRFRQSLLGSVCTMAQTCPLLLDVAGATFDEAVHRARQATMVTYKYAYHDPERRAAMVAAVAEDLGGPVEMDTYFNDRRPPAREERAIVAPSAAEIEAAVGRGGHEWVRWDDVDGALLYLDVDDVPDAIRFTLTGDTHRASPDELVGLLREIETVLVAAALDPGASTGVPS